MSVGWRYGLKFRTVPNAPLSSPSVGVSALGYGGGTKSGTWTYVWRACYDATGKNASAPSGEISKTGSNILFWRVSFANNPPIAGARWYQCFKKISSLPDRYKLAYSGPDMFFDDYGGPTETSYAQTLLTFPDTSGTTYEYDLSPDGGFAHPNDPTKANGFDLVTACEPAYMDQADDDEGNLQSINRNLLRKEFGVRPQILLSFKVFGMSDEEEALTAIFNAKLAYPDKVLKGMKVYITLNGRAYVPTWRECTIKGDLPRTPDSGVNVRLAFTWEVHCTKLLPSVPPINAADLSTLW